jgi:hypothetical protein
MAKQKGNTRSTHVPRKDEGHLLEMYRGLAEAEKVSILVIVESIAWGRVNPVGRVASNRVLAQTRRTVRGARHHG